MSLKSHIENLIGDHSRSLQERLFKLTTIMGLVGLALRLVMEIFFSESVSNIVTMAISIVVLSVIFFITKKTQRIQVGAIIISAIMVYVVFPLNFITAGGIYGGGPIWFILGFIMATIVVSGKVKIFLVAGGYIVFLVCYYIAYNNPELIVQYTLEMAYIDSVTTLTLVSAVACGMLLFQNAIYKSENEMTQKQKKQIEDLNSAQNRFFSSMSHEIRTPINTIIGLNEMIIREAVTDEVAEDALNIQSASKMLLSLINDILDMSKIESGKMDIVSTTYDVGAMLSDIVNMIWVKAKEKGLQFHINVDNNVPAKLRGDEVRIKQILINILNNAVKYTREGSVTLSIQQKQVQGDIVDIVYSVSDTGMGIKKESIPHLFDTFKRVDEENNRYIEGTGLGLSIVKQLVALMGGDIEVNSVYTKGSTFIVTIPQQSEGVAKIGELDFEKRRSTRKREQYKALFEAPRANVLIVDDNETNLLVAAKLLQDTKVNTDTASSGQECLKKAENKRYDVIFMDHLMPVMDGIECLHNLRSQTGGMNVNTPIVVLTANAGSENQEMYKQAGFDGYLLKPVSGNQLETELLRHLPRELVTLTGEFSDEVVGPVLGHRRKQLVMITTDSVSDIPAELVKRYKIAVLPYHVLTEGGDFKDGEEIETDGILPYIQSKEKKAHSKEPSVADYEAFFAEQLTKAQHIIHIAMAKNVSKGFSKAEEASAVFDNVTVIDSGHLSSGMGLVVLRAAKLVQKGADVETIRSEIEYFKSHTKTSFVVGSTEFLARSGRISHRINSFCETFMLHPVLSLKKSSMGVGSILIGSQKRAAKKYIKSVLRNPARIDKRLLFITYAGMRPQELDEIAELVKKRVTFDEVIYQKASPTISINCGPDSFGLIFMEK